MVTALWRWQFFYDLECDKKRPLLVAVLSSRCGASSAFRNTKFHVDRVGCGYSLNYGLVLISGVVGIGG